MNFKKTVKVCNNKERIASAKLYNTFFLRMKGLMFAKRLKKGEAILLAFSSNVFAPIHTLFMRFPIDAVWIDENLKIVDVKKNIKPFTLFVKPAGNAKYVLELNAGSADGLKKGDCLRFK